MLGAEDPKLGTDRFLSSGEVLSVALLWVKWIPHGVVFV